MIDRKQQVLLTARQLFVEKGFSATSVKDILDESNISKGTFYNYFSSKNECLIAILEHAQSESVIRRRELLIGQDISDKSILAKQILVRMQINYEHNLIPIFHDVFHSIDMDLKTFVKKHHLKELSWLTNRLVDVYGFESKPYAPDCAVMIHGIIQHMSYTWTNISQVKMDTQKLITFVLRRIDSIVFDMIHTKDSFLGIDIFSTLDITDDDNIPTKKYILTQLTNFNKMIGNVTESDDQQYIQFLMDEIQSDRPRVFLLETVIRSFREVSKGKQFETEAKELASTVWRYINALEYLD